MMFYTHLAFSLLVGLMTRSFFSVGHPILFILLVLFFGAFPDIDSHHSFMGRKFPIISHILELFFGHRGVFHSIYFPLLFFLFFQYFIGFSLSLAIALGYLSHVVADALTFQGIRPLCPFHSFQLKGFISTGGIAELFLFGILCIVNIYLLLPWI